MSAEERTVYLDVAGKTHSLYKELMLYPPQGYRFTTTGGKLDGAFNSAGSTGVAHPALLRVLGKAAPLNLVKAWLEKLKRPPREAVLTYSAGHLVFRREPWVVDMEFVTQLTGYSTAHFRRYRRLVEKTLASQNCKKVICWTEAGQKTVLNNLNCEDFQYKVEVVPLAVHPKGFVKNYDHSGTTKLLFVGSVNIPGEFEYKGGKETLECFRILGQKYPGLQLTIRSDVPEDLRRRYAGMDNLRIIDGIIPWEQLDQEFRTADIFLFPTHSTPGLVILDAMSYELPVITTDVWANPEMVQHGETGFLIKKSQNIHYYGEDLIPCWDYHKGSKFMKAIGKVDPNVVEELVEKASVLIEDPDLRMKMGKAARERIEKGKFSIASRNEKLKRIFDEALAKEAPCAS
ncbi:MAG: glycosyltransferase family 4 protein [Chloroflexi bacterium]|nr:glycosyltransferase family 4 protein [Chloroflexota bacterium]